MKGIKFRLWDESEMFYPKAIHDERYVIQLNGTIGKFNGKTYNTVEHDLMQFTGLKDKNGVEIYVGDITKTELGIGVVIWNNASFWLASYAHGFEDVGDWTALDFLSRCNDEMEVIGNIYQNKEAYKAGKAKSETLEYFLRNKVDKLEYNHIYQISTCAIRAWIDEFKRKD